MKRDPAQVFQLLLTGIEDLPALKLIVTADVSIRTSWLVASGKIPGIPFPTPVVLFCFALSVILHCEKEQGTVRYTPDKWDIPWYTTAGCILTYFML